MYMSVYVYELVCVVTRAWSASAFRQLDLDDDVMCRMCVLVWRSWFVFSVRDKTCDGNVHLQFGVSVCVWVELDTEPPRRPHPTTLKPHTILQLYFMHGCQSICEFIVNMYVCVWTYYGWVSHTWRLAHKTVVLSALLKGKSGAMSLLLWIDSWLPRKTLRFFLI